MNFKILVVNGRDVSGSTQEEAIAAFEAASEPISVTLTRCGSGASVSSTATVPNAVEVSTQTELPYCHNCHCQSSEFSERCNALAKSLAALIRFHNDIQGQSNHREGQVASKTSHGDIFPLGEKLQDLWECRLRDEIPEGVINDTLRSHSAYSSTRCDDCDFGDFSDLRPFREQCFENGGLQGEFSPEVDRCCPDDTFDSSLRGSRSLSCKDSGVGRTDDNVSNSDKGFPGDTLKMLLCDDEDVFDNYATIDDGACISANHEFYFEKELPVKNNSSKKGDTGFPSVLCEGSRSRHNPTCPQDDITTAVLQSKMNGLDISENGATKNRTQNGAVSPVKLPYVSRNETANNRPADSKRTSGTVASPCDKGLETLCYTDTTSSAYNTADSFTGSITTPIKEEAHEAVNAVIQSSAVQHIPDEAEFYMHGETSCADRNHHEKERNDAFIGTIENGYDSAPLSLKLPFHACKHPSERSHHSHGSSPHRLSEADKLSGTSPGRSGKLRESCKQAKFAFRHEKSRKKQSTSGDSKVPTGCETAEVSDNTCSEWKVRIRSDGTRYVTKRPARERILKEREARLGKERAGLTTDDDFMTELKLGKYWSRHERKKHIERVREYKRRKHFMEQCRLAALQETANDDGIVQLSNKKMLKNKNRKLLDSFMTVQEILAHGSRSLEDASGKNLLNVTYI